MLIYLVEVVAIATTNFVMKFSPSIYMVDMHDEIQ